MHRVAVIGAGTLDSLPHNGAVVTLLAVCGSTHRESYFDIVMVGIVGADAGAGRGDRARLGVRILLTRPEDVKMLKHVARAGLIAAAVAWGTASAQTTVNYGRITNVTLVTEANRAAQTGGAILGGALGAASARNRSGGTAALRAGGGVLAGQQLGRIATQSQTFEYTILIGGTSTVRMVTDEAGLRVGDCVAVERGQFNNLRLVDDSRCNPRPAAQGQKARRPEGDRGGRAPGRRLHPGEGPAARRRDRGRLRARVSQGAAALPGLTARRRARACARTAAAVRNAGIRTPLRAVARRWAARARLVLIGSRVARRAAGRCRATRCRPS